MNVTKEMFIPWQIVINTTHMSFYDGNQFKVFTKGVSFVPCCVVAAEDTDVTSSAWSL